MGKCESEQSHQIALTHIFHRMLSKLFCISSSSEFLKSLFFLCPWFGWSLELRRYGFSTVTIGYYINSITNKPVNEPVLALEDEDLSGEGHGEEVHDQYDDAGRHEVSKVGRLRVRC